MKLRQYIREALERLFEQEKTPIIKGVDILQVRPFNELPQTRKEVDFKNRGNAYLPSIEGIGKTHILSKDDILGSEAWTHPTSNKIFKMNGYINDFKEKYGEEPLFAVNLDGSIQILNEPYKAMEKMQTNALKSFGTEGD